MSTDFYNLALQKFQETEKEEEEKRYKVKEMNLSPEEIPSGIY